MSLDFSLFFSSSGLNCVWIQSNMKEELNAVGDDSLLTLEVGTEEWRLTEQIAFLANKVENWQVGTPSNFLSYSIQFS